MSGDLFRVTFTRIRAFLRCQKQYWFDYESGLEWPPAVQTPAGVVGTGVHRAMRVLCETGSADTAADELDSYLRMPDHECAGPGTPHHDEAFAILRHGCEAHDAIESEASWAELDTWAPSKRRGITLRARIDRADRISLRSYQVIDWKTGRWEMDEDTDFQLDIGHVALRVSRRLPRDAGVTAIAWNLRTGRRRVRELWRDDGRATMDRAAGIADRMRQAETFEASPGSHCGFCRWRDRCEEAAAIQAGDWDWDDDPFD